MSKNREIIKKSALFKRLIPYVMKEKKLLFLSLFLTIVISGINAFTPFVTKSILDDLLPKEEYLMIVYYLLFYLVLILVLSISRYFFQYVITLTGMKIEKKLREQAIEKINYLPVDYYSLEPDGKIVAKITSDCSGIKTFYVTMFQIINAIINILIVYIGVIILNPMLGILILIIVPIILLWVTLYRRKVHRYYVELRETGSKITGKLNELITGTLIIQDFNLEDDMQQEYEDLAYDYVKHDRKANIINIYFGFELLSLIKRAAEISLLMFLGFNSIDVIGTTVSIGMISAFIENLDKMINPINAIFNNLNELEDSLVGATRALGFIDETPDSRIFDGEEAPDEIKGEVEFKNVTFSYIPGKVVLDNVSVHFDASKKIGIVGHTGSGKSSLMNLLLGYNDVDSGQVLIDGVDIATYNKASYRKNLGIILQTPALFAGTIKSNVTMNREYSDEEVINVLKQVGAEDLINKTSDGIYMPISFRGENLSLGEKQLVAFARILLRNPKILVLDEATANIDTETEIKIKHTMDLVAKGRTTFIIAHRLSTIADADEIIVVDNGHIIGVGKHDKLYQECPTYKDIYDSQMEKSIN